MSGIIRLFTATFANKLQRLIMEPLKLFNLLLAVVLHLFHFIAILKIIKGACKAFVILAIKVLQLNIWICI